MYRYLFVAGFVVLVGLQTAFMAYALQSNLSSITLEDTDISLQRSTSLIEKSHRLDEFALKEKARHVANRPGLREAMVADYEGDWEVQRHVEVGEKLLTEDIRFDQWAENTADQRNLDRDLQTRRPLDLEMFMALDDGGRLIAAEGPGLNHLMGDDIGGQFSIVGQVMESGDTAVDMWNWAWRAADERELYIVAIAPIQAPDTDEIVGTVVLGYQVTDGGAERFRSLVADGLGEDGPSNGETRLLSDRERTQAPELVFFRGDRFYSSTLSGRKRGELADELFNRHEILEHEEPEKILDTDLEGETHRTMVRFFPGQFETNNPAGVVLTTSRDEAVAPFVAARSTVISLGATILVVGIGLILLGFYFFRKPLGRIEEGIQEILSGDKNYTFETGISHDIADNLAHHLNLLSAYLQGKPMPDEEQSMGGWEGFDEPDDTAESGDADVAGVPMDLGSGDTSSDGETDDDDNAGDETKKSAATPDDEPAGEPT